MTVGTRVLVRLGRVAQFVVYFGWAFVRANAEVLQEILTPRPRAAPAIIAMPLHSRTRPEIVTVANLITLTPGTLTVEVAEHPPTLYVHGMFAADPEAFLADLHALEARMLAAMRPVGGGGTR